MPHTAVRSNRSLTYSSYSLPESRSTAHTAHIGVSLPRPPTELIAYQLIIVQHSRKFEYPSRLRYDIDFLQWVALNWYHTWSQIHPQFYSFTSTTQGNTSDWFSVCLPPFLRFAPSSTHKLISTRFNNFLLHCGSYVKQDSPSQGHLHQNDPVWGALHSL